FSGVKRELAPPEDQGLIMAVMKAPKYANLDYMERYAPELERAFRAFPEADTSFILNGYNGSNLGFAGVNLVDWSKRERGAAQLQGIVQNGASAIEGEQIFTFLLPSLPASSGGLPVQMVVRAPADYPQLYETVEKLKAAAGKSGLFSTVD
ncbi:efflux RND transporter permease subunit, partial [Burkholderia ambifaria]|uniref:efflux RND transporter permease subunit n=1 Tax=Burkholderia ambifaria TaxID=152480 RepID=UPI0015893B3A